MQLLWFSQNSQFRYSSSSFQKIAIQTSSLTEVRFHQIQLLQLSAMSSNDASLSKVGHGETNAPPLNLRLTEDLINRPENKPQAVSNLPFYYFLSCIRFRNLHLKRSLTTCEPLF